MDDLIDCKKQSHDTNSFTEHHILVQCKTKRTENFFKCGEETDTPSDECRSMN
jgi:hypothetical protein